MFYDFSCNDFNYYVGTSNISIVWTRNFTLLRTYILFNFLTQWNVQNYIWTYFKLYFTPRTLHSHRSIRILQYVSPVRITNTHGLHYGSITFYVFYLRNIIGASEDIDSGRNPHYYDIRGCLFNHSWLTRRCIGIASTYSNYYYRCVTANKVVTAVNEHAVRSPRKTPDNSTSYFRSDFLSSLSDSTVRTPLFHCLTLRSYVVRRRVLLT